MVVTNGTRVTYGYPGITFQSFSRDDSATYNLTATNYRLDDTSVVVGTDMGSLTLDVQCKLAHVLVGVLRTVKSASDFYLRNACPSVLRVPLCLHCKPDIVSKV